MKKSILAFLAAAVIVIAGCTSTITHYDENGKVTKVEQATNVSRVMDGTNQKSQLILVDGTYIKSDISATAGESYTPGWVIKFVNGKTAIVNAKDNAKFDCVSDSIEKFFQTYTITKDGVKTEKASTPASTETNSSVTIGGGGSAAKESVAAK